MTDAVELVDRLRLAELCGCNEKTLQRNGLYPTEPDGLSEPNKPSGKRKRLYRADRADEIIRQLEAKKAARASNKPTTTARTTDKPLRRSSSRAELARTLTGESCAECGKRLSALVVQSADPFCSTACCRRHFGVVSPFNHLDDDALAASVVNEPGASSEVRPLSDAPGSTLSSLSIPVPAPERVAA